MFTILPDFTPQDSHSLWYTSRTPFPSPASRDARHAGAGSGANAVGHGSHHSRSRGQVVERTALARLAADELHLDRRRANIKDFGSVWLKPPGVHKTLHQMREEKREQEEHQEALRREQLAQELAEAEAGALPDDGMMDDVQLDGAQDLDDEIPDADDPYGMDDDDDDDDEENEDEGEDENEEAAADATQADDAALREEHQNDLMAARMRMTDDAFREALVRGDPDGDGMYGGDEELEQVTQGQMLDEDDFAHGNGDNDGATGLDMDADLDDDVPEAGSGGGYEHTDSEAELSSSSNSDGGDVNEDVETRDTYFSSDDGARDSDDDDAENPTDHEIGFAPRTASLGPPQSPSAMRRRGSMAGPRSSMDLSNLLSNDVDESSFVESSPAQSRLSRYG